MEGLTWLDAPDILGSGRFKEDGSFFCFCKGGSLRFTFLNSDFSFSEGDALIIRNHLSCFSLQEASPDFSMVGVFASNALIISLGVGKYAADARRKASLFLNPVISMSPERSHAVLQSFENLQKRLEARDVYHYEDAVGLAFTRLVLDISEGHFERYLTQKTADANADIFYRFIDLLEGGHYKFHRDVSWYADQLCVTPKHLSYCAKMAAGRSAEYWIDSICVNNLVDSLKTHPVKEVCEEYHFSSLSYLSRYVKRLTGLSPRDIR